MTDTIAFLVDIALLLLGLYCLVMLNEPDEDPPDNGESTRDDFPTDNKHGGCG